MNRAHHVYVDLPALTYHDDGRCPTIAGTHVRPLRRAALRDIQLSSCPLCCAARGSLSWLRRAVRRGRG